MFPFHYHELNYYYYYLDSFRAVQRLKQCSAIIHFQNNEARSYKSYFNM